MSELARLKQNIDGIAQSAQTASANLAMFEQKFSQQSQAVQQIIGGSAQGKDRDVMSSIEQASRAVRQAGAALERAAKVARQYGSSI